MTRVDFEIGKIDKERLEAVSYQKRLGNFKTLLDRHIFWTVVLEELSKYTYKPVSYTSLQADIKEYKLMVSGFVPSYTDLGKLMLGLKTSSNIEKKHQHLDFLLFLCALLLLADLRRMHIFLFYALLFFHCH